MPSDPEHPNRLSMQEVADLLGVNYETVRGMCKRYLARPDDGLEPPIPREGELPCCRLGSPRGGKIIIPRKSLEEMGLL